MNTNDPGWTSVTTSCAAQNSAVPVPPVRHNVDRVSGGAQIAHRKLEAPHRCVAARAPLGRVTHVLEVALVPL